MSIKTQMKFFLIGLLFIIGGCVSAKAKVAADNKLDSILHQQTEVKTVANHIDKNVAETKQQVAENLNLSKTLNNSGTIRYGGSGWLTLALIAVLLVFMFPIVLIIWLVFKSNRLKDLLTLVTSAIKQAPSEAAKSVTDTIVKETSEGKFFNTSHRNALTAFVKKVGTNIP